jgi:fructan beta-fructosidase
VLPNPGIIDFRDPKVAWNEVSDQWVMTLAVKDHIEFYGSLDLKNWIKLSEFGKTLGGHGGVWECPDLFPLTDDQGDKKWVLFVSINPGGPQGGSATQYFIGDFDGKKFTSQDTLTRWIDHGADNYAGVTWSDIPASDGRRLFLGWMSNWQYAQVVPTKVWRSAMTLPREILLMNSPGTYELKFKPAAELMTILHSSSKFNGDAKLETPLAMIAFDLKDDEKEFSLALSNDEEEKVQLSLKDGVLIFDRSVSGIHDFDATFTNIQRINVSSLKIKNLSMYIDLASIEIFINDGERVCTNIVFPTKPYDQVHLEKKDPEFSVSVISPVLNF